MQIKMNFWLKDLLLLGSSKKQFIVQENDISNRLSNL